VTIKEIFREKHGASHFRTAGSQALGELSALDGKDIETGGGAAAKYQKHAGLQSGTAGDLLGRGPETRTFLRIRRTRRAGVVARPALHGQGSLTR